MFFILTLGVLSLYKLKDAFNEMQLYAFGGFGEKSASFISNL